MSEASLSIVRNDQRVSHSTDTRTAERFRTQRNKNAGIAKILIGNAPTSEEGRDHAGMGIVVGTHHVITCAHVINVAIGREKRSLERPAQPVTVSFPMLGDFITVRGSVVKWRAPGPNQQDDVAVLELDGPAPAEAGLAMLADITGMSTDGDQLSIFGVRAGCRLGTHVDARFKGSTSAAWIQVDGADREGAFIEGGFSGAAVWDFAHSAVLGMLVAKNVSEQQRVAYMIPAEDLKAVWPGLEIEHRSLPLTFARTWTIYSGVYFLLILAHFASDKGVDTFSALTLSGNHKNLASFWGMHVYAFLSPILLLMLIGYARALRLHDWVRRIPSFGVLRAGPPISSSTWRTAGISIAAFVILPLVAQVLFIADFHKHGEVYVYPSSFGYDSGDPIFAGEKCYRNGVELCTMVGADRYSLATPKAGSPAQYLDNAYQFGDRRGGRGSTTTFFPILQPLLIIALTALSSVLTAYALFLIFRRRPPGEQQPPS